MCNRPDQSGALGQVTLVGAGPGDPELLTLKALKAIQAATTLFVDDLVSTEVLAYAQPNAKIVRVGKRGGRPSTAQTTIEDLLLAAALRGENVVRLKGGDPFLFGRGGEEVQFLQAHGVPVAVINGITSALAAASALQVPLTHRDHAHGVVFITGHPQAPEAEPDWPALARMAQQSRLTLVIYMGVRGVQGIQNGLLAGLPHATPVAIVQNASLPTQRQYTGTLGGLAHLVAQHHIGSPAIILVGEVLCSNRVTAVLAMA